MIFFHKIFKMITVPYIEKYLEPKYLQDGDEEIIMIYKNKVATNIYKFIFYLFSTILGFYVLKDMKFFPWSMGGSGESKRIFEDGYPGMFYFDKPELFDIYYNLNLSFALFDGFILISNPLQSDFLFMVLHHLATYSLVVFSFLCNHSAIGCIVYFVHYFGDVFSYVVRVAVHLNVDYRISFWSTFVFLVVFSYTRLFVFGDLLYHTYTKMNFTWRALEISLTSFLAILMFLNVLWIALISKKFIKYIQTGNIEEIYKIKISKNKKAH